MDILVLSLVAIGILLLGLHVLPLGMTFKGKVIIALCAGLIATVSYFVKEWIVLWQLYVGAALLLIVISYVLATRFGKLMEELLDENDELAIAGLAAATVFTASDKEELHIEPVLKVEESAVGNVREDNLDEVDLQTIEDLNQFFNAESPIDHPKTTVEAEEWEMEEIVSPLNDLLEEEVSKKIV